VRGVGAGYRAVRAGSVCRVPPPDDDVIAGTVSRAGGPGGYLALVRRGGSFLVVGAVGYLVDVVTFNALVHVGDPGVLHDAPLTAKVVAIAVASVATYVGNRHWTFRGRRQVGRVRGYTLFALLNALAVAIAVGCLAFSRYVLGLDSVLADNVAGNVVGQTLATVFRFWSYGRWVFPH
jgi:putative flippase GtrA